MLRLLDDSSGGVRHPVVNLLDKASSMPKVGTRRGAAVAAEVIKRKSELLPPEPLLFTLREYVPETAASTTTCKASNTSPVQEYTPDD